MTHTLIGERKEAIQIVGVEITDTNLYFIELDPQVVADQTLLIPRAYGTVGITFDAVDDGQVLNKTRVLESIKKLRQRTKSSQVVLSAFGNADTDEQWQELFMVAGFTQAVSLSTPGALTARISQDSVVAHFSKPNVIQLIANGTVVNTLRYPLDIDGIYSLQDAKTQNEGILYVSGHVPQQYDAQQKQQDVRLVFADYDTDVSLLNIWSDCFKFDQFIPTMSESKTPDYATAASLAYCLARYTTEKTPAVVIKEEKHMVAPDVKEVGQQKKSLQQAWTAEKTASNSAVDSIVNKNSAELKKIEAETKKQKSPSAIAQLFLPRNKKLQKKVLAKPVVITQDQAKTEPVVNVMDALINKPQIKTDPKPVAKKSIWLQDADKIIYEMFGRQGKDK